MRVGRGARLARPPGGAIPDFYWDLIVRCWDQNPSKRPTFVEILAVLQMERASYAFPGADLGALEEYERRILEGVELVNRTGIPAPAPHPIVLDFSAPADDDDEPGDRTDIWDSRERREAHN